MTVWPRRLRNIRLEWFSMKAAVYLRQSVDKLGDELAISRQRKDCLTLCEKRGWTPVEYVDNDTSASSRKPRPAYQQMLADIESGAIGAVVVWHLDRLHRKPAELEHFVDLADRHHLALATVTGDVDLSTAQGRLHARIMGAVARNEVEQKSARQTAAMRQLAESGKPNKTARPFGYTKDRQQLVEAEAAAVRDGYAMLLSGGSLYSIAQTWNAAGLRSTYGRTWTGRTVRQALLNARYAGLRSYKDEVLEGVKAAWPAIVSEDIWRSAVAILTDPNRPGGARPRRHLLTGLALCGKCGGVLSSGVKRRTDGGVYTCKHCFGVSRAAELIDPLAVDLALGFLASPDAADLLIDRKRGDLNDLRQQERALLQQLDQLAVDYDEGNLTGRQVKIATERKQQRLDAVRAEMRDANKARVFDGLIGAQNVREVWDGLSLERQRAVLATLFVVTIKPIGSGRYRFDPDNHVAIRWLTGED